MGERRESKVYVNMDTRVKDRLNTVIPTSSTSSLICPDHSTQEIPSQIQQPPLNPSKSKSEPEPAKSFAQQQAQEHNTKSFSSYSFWATRMWSASLSVLILALLPSYVFTGDYDCGINRFNNESPLTERIVGGNNSLQ